MGVSFREGHTSKVTYCISWHLFSKRSHPCSKTFHLHCSDGSCFKKVCDTDKKKKKKKKSDFSLETPNNCVLLLKDWPCRMIYYRVPPTVRSPLQAFKMEFDFWTPMCMEPYLPQHVYYTHRGLHSLPLGIYVLQVLPSNQTPWGLLFSPFWLWRLLCMHLRHVWLFATPWTIACQTPLSLEFSRQQYWSGLSFPPPNLPDWDRIPISCTGSWILYHWVTWEATEIIRGSKSRCQHTVDWPT